MKNLQAIKEKLRWVMLNRVVVPTVDRIPRLMPEGSRNQLMHQVMKRRFDRYMKEKLRGFAVDVDPGPAGSEEIITKTAVLKQQDVKEKADPDVYFMTGYSVMLSWMKTLEKHSFNFRTAAAIMELGCGSARLIRHLRCIDGVRLVASDVDSQSIEWCRQNVPGIEFYTNDLYPPLPFAEPNSFDLVFALSVFTHIPLEAQGPWIEEIHRILRPGGFFLADVLGRHHQSCMLNAEDLQCLRKNGHLVLGSDHPRASFSTRAIGSWDIFQTRQEVLKAFRSVFHVHDYLPAALDLLVMQKLNSA